MDRCCQVTEEEILQELEHLRTPGFKAPAPVIPAPGPCYLGSGRLQNENLSSVGRIPEAGTDILDMTGVCEDLSSTDHEQFFNQKFDQLAKLHQLYQSVSSINAKCQSRLENDRNRGLREHSSSLTALLTDNSSHSSVSDDLNSLCSEPAWFGTSPFLDINKNSTLSLNIMDLCNFSGGKNSISLRSLSIPTGDNFSGENSLMELNIESIAMEERCDSPILEGIDSELAKYAKLRDLKQAYNPRCEDICDIGGRLSALRHPDGASNPDLQGHTAPDTGSNPSFGREVKPEGEKGETVRRDLNPTSIEKVSLPSVCSLSQRSPGTGRSSSGSDPEETLHNRTYGRSLQKAGDWRRVDPATRVPEPGTKAPEQKPGPETSRPENISQEENKSKVMKEPGKKEEKVKVPKFSRLFGNARKISRSPSQANKPNEDKSRSSKASKHKSKPPLAPLIPSDVSSKLAANGELIINNEVSSKNKSKLNPCKDSKNVKGTLSSGPSCEKKRSRNLFKGLKKTKNQGVNLVSIPGDDTRAEGRSKSVSEVRSKPVSEGRRRPEPSGYDSGIDVTPRGGRGKGANVQLQHKLSRDNCRSSGYESYGLESERESLDSCQGTLNRSKDRLCSRDRLCSDSVRAERNNSSPLPILDYDQTFVTRLDSLWRFQEIKRLQKRQELLKTELSSAKERINVDPKRWSFDLHTQSSGLDQTDPSFVEAFQRETEILGKRVAACQSHVVLTTCFDHPGCTDSESLGCTSDCVPSWAYTEEQSTVSNL